MSARAVSPHSDLTIAKFPGVVSGNSTLGKRSAGVESGVGLGFGTFLLLSRAFFYFKNKISIKNAAISAPFSTYARWRRFENLFIPEPNTIRHIRSGKYWPHLPSDYMRGVYARQH